MKKQIFEAVCIDSFSKKETIYIQALSFAAAEQKALKFPSWEGSSISKFKEIISIKKITNSKNFV